MDSITSTDDLCPEIKLSQENILLEIIKELCAENNKLSGKLRGKVTRIITECNLAQYSSLHKLSTANESTTTLLGFMSQTQSELTFNEQTELNQAIVQKIQTKLPTFITELEKIKQNSRNNKNSRRQQIQELQASLDDKLNTIEEQENEKVELMMEWLNHRHSEVMKFSEDSTELLTLRTKILELKSKILHLQTLQNIFTETNQSIKAYAEVRTDLKDRVSMLKDRIKGFQQIIDSDFN